jgi:hypothetical protein
VPNADFPVRGLGPPSQKLIGVKFERMRGGRFEKILHSPVDEYFEGIDALELPECAAHN